MWSCFAQPARSTATQIITHEIGEKIRSYNPGNYRVLIGHSFSASFAMYSYLLSPDFYSAIIANSPLDQLENLIKAFQQDKHVNISRLYLSYGSVEKDSYHRKAYEEMKAKYPDFFNQVHTFLANFSGHTAMPIASVPMLLNEAFNGFDKRYNEIGKVDEMYKLVEHPGPVTGVLDQIGRSSTLGGQPFPPELPELNGIASRYQGNGYKDYAIKIYEMGLKYYPNYYGFHYQLAELYADSDKQKARDHIAKTIELLKQYSEANYAAMITDIEKLKEKNGL